MNRSAESIQPLRQVRGWSLSVVRNLAMIDLLVMAYFGVMLLAVAAGTGPHRAACETTVIHDLLALGLALILIRGGVLRPDGLGQALGSRLVAPCAVVFSYFQLRAILPVVTGAAYDAQLLAFDLRVFGVEPAVAWDRWVSPATTEWFAFYYFGYYFLLLIYLGGMVFWSRDVQRLSAFAFGIILVFCTTHLLYMVVPAFGPYAALQDTFAHPLTGGIWWHTVQASVHAGGAMKDVFPSLHTGAPAFLTLFSWRHRRHRVFRWAVVPVAFFTLQIIGATMFLRWHYLIDVVAGLAVAGFADHVAARVAPWEARRRMKAGVDPVLTRLRLRAL